MAIRVGGTDGFRADSFPVRAQVDIRPRTVQRRGGRQGCASSVDRTEHRKREKTEHTRTAILGLLGQPFYQWFPGFICAPSVADKLFLIRRVSPSSFPR